MIPGDADEQIKIVREKHDEAKRIEEFILGLSQAEPTENAHRLPEFAVYMDSKKLEIRSAERKKKLLAFLQEEMKAAYSEFHVSAKNLMELF